MMKKLLLLLCLTSTQLFSQTFERTYNLFQNPEIYFVQPLLNGGYILCGKAINTVDGTYDFCFFRTDEEGNVIWSNQMNDNSVLNMPADEWAAVIRENTDGSYTFGGSAGDPSYSNSVAYYGHIDVSGNLINSFNISTTWTTSVNALLIEDNGNIVSTRDDNEGAGHHHNALEVRAQSGQYLSGSSAGNYSIGEQGLVKMADGGYGTISSAEDYSVYYYSVLPTVSRFDQGGNAIWTYNMHNETGVSDTAFIAIAPTSDTGMLACGYVSGNILLTRFNSAGDSLWTKTILTGNATPSAIQSTDDGGFVITGTYNYQMMLLKIDANADSSWMKTFGSAIGNVDGIYLQQTADGGYIILGHANTNSSTYLVKTDSNGNITTAPVTTNTGKVDPAKFNLYPDPFSSSINVTAPGNSSCQFTICDMTGRVVFSKQMTKEANHFELPYFPPGVYNAIITDEFSRSSMKLVRE